MATNREIKEVASAMLLNWSKSESEPSKKKRSDELTRHIEALAEIDQRAKRDRSIRVSADGMYIRRNTGTYISKPQAAIALEMIEKLAKKK